MRGYGYIHGGILRSVFVLTRTESVRTSPMGCMLQIYQTLMILGQKASPMIVLGLSIDRFLAVTLFNTYRTFGAKYALLVISCCYTLSGIVTCMAWVSAYFWMPATLRVAQTCKTDSVTPRIFFSVETFCR